MTAKTDNGAVYGPMLTAKEARAIAGDAMAIAMDARKEAAEALKQAREARQNILDHLPEKNNNLRKFHSVHSAVKPKRKIKRLNKQKRKIRQSNKQKRKPVTVKQREPFLEQRRPQPDFLARILFSRRT